jgi:two-component system, NtrC family, sensor kinase
MSPGGTGFRRKWVRRALALAVLIPLAILGIANVGMRLRLHEVEDGVLWLTRPEGVTAVEVASSSPADVAGVQRGDVLIAVNGLPVQAPADVIALQGLAREGARFSYTLVRLGARQVLEVSLQPVPVGSPMYFVLAAVGMFTLLVGAFVRLRRPLDDATFHFFWLCIAFFGAFTFSFNGPLNRLDWVFYWGDALGMALLPPVLLHFTLVFPQRPSASPPGSRRSAVAVPLIYLPALVIAGTRMLVVARGGSEGLRLPSAIAALDQAELVNLVACSTISLAVVIRAFRTITSVTARRQLQWVAWGTALGAGPFAFGYALPWALDFDPPIALQLTAIPLGLLPLMFASAIVRYRLRDVEVIVKRGLAYAAFLAASAALFFAVLKVTGSVFSQDPEGRNWILALLATLVVVLLAQPVKEALQDGLDRLFYRDRYDYRRALVGFARDLNSDLDVLRVGQRLLDRVVETLVVDRMALMLADERSGDFESISEVGFLHPPLPLPRTSSFVPRLDGGHTVALDDPGAAARYAAEEIELWRDAGIDYLVPCVFEGGAIAVLALGRKRSGEPFNSEDLALLTAVAGQVATAIENGRLYRQLHVKAQELGRMRELNENILESLDDGLVVLDTEERIVRWNRALERFYGLSREDAIGRTLGDVFDASFVEGLRAARRDQPKGACLYRVPLSARERAHGGAVESPGSTNLDARPTGENRPAVDDGRPSTGSRDTRRLLVNATAVPLQAISDGSVAVVGTILLIEDITERVRLEEQLQISEKMASIGLLAAGVAHEVNTPLTGISSFAQMLLEGADPADPKTVLLEKIERQTFRAAKIVNGLLTLSRPSSVGSERAPVDLNAVVTDVFSLIEHQLEMSKVKVRRDLAPQAVRALAIEPQLQQVFLNLFLNARDAMPRGGWLSVATREEGDEVVVEVSDTGSGIPAEHLTRIYDPFFTTKASGRGTGLGLSITYGIIREHGGRIQCDSVTGQGTRFTLRLPRGGYDARGGTVSDPGLGSSRMAN